MTEADRGFSLILRSGLIGRNSCYLWSNRFSIGLDAKAEVYVLLVAGVGVEVVGGLAIELVALA